MGTAFANFLMLHSPDGLNPDVPPVKLDGSVAYAATFTAMPFRVERVGTLSIHVSCPATGTPNGSFAIQGTNDASSREGSGGNDNTDANMVNWATLSFFDEATGLTVQSKAVSGASQFIVTIPIVSSRWVRLVWTNTSGSANLTVKVQTRAVS